MFVKVSAVPALSLAAYVAKDCVGALLTFTIGVDNLAVGNTASAVIKRVQITDAAVQSEAYSLHLFDASPAAAARTDADECVQVAADLAKKIVTYTIAAADYQAFAGDSIVSYEKDTAIVYDGKAIYGVLEATDTPDYVAVDDLTVTLWVELR
jgi:hypothetical protein